MSKEQNKSKTGSGHSTLSLVFDILKRQIAISANFLTLLESEKQALIDMDMNSIVSLTYYKENELAKMGQLDHSLQEVARQICDEENQGDRIIKLVELLPFMSREQSAELQKYQDQLTDLREKIIDNNLINRRFTSDTLGYINDAISLICGEISNDQLYSTRGQHRTMSAAPTLVSMEV